MDPLMAFLSGLDELDRKHLDQMSAMGSVLLTQISRKGHVSGKQSRPDYVSSHYHPDCNPG